MTPNLNVRKFDLAAEKLEIGKFLSRETNITNNNRVSRKPRQCAKISLEQGNLKGSASLPQLLGLMRYHPI